MRPLPRTATVLGLAALLLAVDTTAAHADPAPHPASAMGGDASLATSDAVTVSSDPAPAVRPAAAGTGTRKQVRADRERVRRWQFGRSVRGRPLMVTRLGPAKARTRVLVVGCIHGNECDGRPVVRALRRTLPPKDVAYYLVRNLNPDGAAARTRHNARGVDLNRNFPARWRPNGKRWSTYYPGRRRLSEPESRALHRLIRRVRPTLSVHFHQALDVVDLNAGRRRSARVYARTARMRVTRLGRRHGSVATWQHRRSKRRTVLVVELPAKVTERTVRRHTRAVRRTARL